MKNSFLYILIAISLVATACSQQKECATVRINAKNLDGRELFYHRSYNGVYLSTFTPIKLEGDSVFILSIPTKGIERMMLVANDPNNKLSSIYKSCYLLPGETEITIDPLSENMVEIITPTGNELDGLAAQSVDDIYDIWLALATWRKDKLGLWSDSIPGEAAGKLDCLVDSLINIYSDASPAVSKAVERDARLEALMVFNMCSNLTKNKENAAEWKQELNRLRNEIDMANPSNALNPFFAEQIMGQFYYQDLSDNGHMHGQVSPDSLLNMKMAYFINVLKGKAAEAAIGTMLYKDGANNTFSPGVPELTKRFKNLFPESELIPLLEDKVEENKAFNNPESIKEIVFIDNTSIKTLEDIIAPYRGTPVLIDFWATWCGPCRRSFAHVRPIQEYADENGVQLLYLSIDEQPGIEEQWKRMAKFYKLKGHHMLINSDVKSEVYSTFGENGVLAIPHFAIVDREGNISLCPQQLSENADFEPLRALLDNVK